MTPAENVTKVLLDKTLILFISAVGEMWMKKYKNHGLFDVRFSYTCSEFQWRWLLIISDWVHKTMYESSESEYGEPDINFVEDTIFIHNVSMVVPDNTNSREFKVIAVRTFL